MCVFTVFTKLQQNFVLRGLGDKANVSGSNLWCSTLGSCQGTENTHLFSLCMHANKMKMQSFK